MASRADVDRCSASRASHQQDGFAAVTMNSGTSCALDLVCANMFPPLHGAFSTCVGQPSHSVSSKLLDREALQLRIAPPTGSKPDRTDRPAPFDEGRNLRTSGAFRPMTALDPTWSEPAQTGHSASEHSAPGRAAGLAPMAVIALATQLFRSGSQSPMSRVAKLQGLRSQV